ncbi:MAG: hypothetical protein ICV83_03800, partial [Cytophagales bacterium]|nr:hypothetical protein [Cytophagales bacterium]
MFHLDQNESREKGFSACLCRGLAAALVLLLAGPVSLAQTAATVTVSGTQSGTSTNYMGVMSGGP